jgi:hypothetical protein
MTDQQFSDLMKVLRSINGNLEDIKNQMPESNSHALINIQTKLDTIDSSVKDVEFAINNKD